MISNSTLGSLVLSFGLCAAACGGSDSRPASDPAMASTTSSRDLAGTGGSTMENPSVAAPAPTKLAGEPASTSSANVAKANTAAATPPTNTASGAPTQPIVTNDPGAANQTASATNTKINERDRHGSTLTPLDQGNSKEEINITASIRKAVMGDKSLSFTAKNVKIITTGTKVTLRGPVSTDQERSTIGTRATQTAGVTEVDNQLEVKK